MDTITWLADFENSVTVPEAATAVPAAPGVYALFVDDAYALPNPYCEVLRRNGTRLLYIGSTNESLRHRAIDQDTLHRGPSCFFRGIGAVLGHRPEPGSLRGKDNPRNYRFPAEGTKATRRWIARHISVSWREVPPALALGVETVAIGLLCPALNTTHNPRAISELARLRAACRSIARQSA